MEQRQRDALLAKTVKRYLNGYLYTYWNQNRMKPDMARQVLSEMEKLEDSLRSLGVTDKQIDQIINYGQVIKSVLWTEISYAGLKHIMRYAFSKEIEKSDF